MNRIGVLGSGAWGTALAVLARRAGSETVLWTRNSNVRESIENTRINEAYLPDVFIDPSIKVTDELANAAKSDALLIVIPAQYLRSVCISLSDLVEPSVPLVICTKGIERGSLAMMSEVVEGILPHNPIAVLSGPNFAHEAAAGLPTASTIACADPLIADKLLYAIGGQMFRLYVSNDIIGTQIGGAVKNVIAIACGIAIAKGFGENARAALITRGLAEMNRLCVAKGGKRETLMGLSGIGDLLLTCSSTKSRNMSLGIRLGKDGGNDQPYVKKGVTEGVATADSLRELSQKLGVSMPICTAVYRILYEKADVNDTIKQLLDRPFSQEIQGTS